MQLHRELGSLLRRRAAALGAQAERYAALERPRHLQHGDLASSLAMKIAGQLAAGPRSVAAQLAEAAAAHPAVAAAKVAGPGFVNLTLTGDALCGTVSDILAQGGDYGRGGATGNKVLLEFVSANPTGPLHVGHGRAAALGDSIARILRFAGDEVSTEYYLNDRGHQADLLAASLWLRACDVEPMPPGAYAGAYLAALAQGLDVAGAPAPALQQLPADRDAAARELVARAKAALGARFAGVRNLAISGMLKNIQAELAAFEVSFDRWFSERAMHDAGAVDAALQQCAERGAIYTKDGAQWFRATAYGDDKDWVVVRSSGEKTYFASDIAYHLDKCRRGYDLLCNLFGADHHGYVRRLAAALRALDEDPAKLQIDLIQFVAIVNAGERIKMSTRSGTFVALQELIDAVGAPAARLSFVLGKSDSAMDFDIAKVSRQSADNPVYYLQYAHARSCSLLERWGGDTGALEVDPAALDDPAAKLVLAELLWLAPTFATAARERAPHRIAHWLLALASALHGFYDKVPILSGAPAARPSRLALVAATRQALANGLGLLGVDAPAKM